jgi:phosphomannomutase
MLTDRGFTNWYIVEEQENPDPDFTTVGYPNPESPAAFKMSEELGRKVGAELLMATDPDSDRFAIEIRDDKGDYIPLNGNQTGYILVNYILEGRKTAGTLPTNGAMVKSIVTSTLTTDIAESYGVKMYEALTGFKNICGRIPFLHENDLVYLFGYEESVGYAASEDIRDKDGISAGMLVAEAAAYYRLQGKTLWDVLNDIYEKYGCAVLCKGGHQINDANDLLYDEKGPQWFYGKRICNPNTHGTGCTLSSAIASNLAKGKTMEEAVKDAKDYISGALAAMLDLGKGSGPLAHNFAIL